MRGQGRVFQRRGSSRWWIAFYVKGREIRESGGATPAEARRKLRARLNEILTDRYVGPDGDRLTVGQLLDSLLVHLEARGVRSLVSLRSHLKPIRERFGDHKAAALTSTQVERFMRDRLEAEKTRSTVNREVQPLKQAFNLAYRQGRLSRVPYIPLLKEDNARQGFFEPEEFEALVAELPAPVDDIARFAYYSGWRKGEITGLRWQVVDRKAKEVRLRTSKTGYGRILPLEGDLWDLMERRWAAREFVRQDKVKAISDHVFHLRGRPLQEFRKSWATACKKAGIPDRLFHDLRRTAVRNMIRAGVPQSVAMALSGHRTISMFLRYNITSDEDRREAVRSTIRHIALLQRKTRRGPSVGRRPQDK